MSTEPLRILAVAAVLAVAGCGIPGASVTGKVTVDGQPLKDGYVTFTPEDGKGASAGCPVKDGAYSISGVQPGYKVMTVEASGGDGPSVQSSAEMEKLSKEWRSKAGPDGIIRTETVSQTTGGNNQRVTLKAGNQTVDIALKKTAQRK